MFYVSSSSYYVRKSSLLPVIKYRRALTGLVTVSQCNGKVVNLLYGIWVVRECPDTIARLGECMEVQILKVNYRLYDVMPYHCPREIKVYTELHQKDQANSHQ